MDHEPWTKNLKLLSKLIEARECHIYVRMGDWLIRVRGFNKYSEHACGLAKPHIAGFVANHNRFVEINVREIICSQYSHPVPHC